MQKSQEQSIAYPFDRIKKVEVSAVGKGMGHILPPFAFVAVTLDFPVSLSVASLAEAHMQKKLNT
jgi:hypothetical protein